MGRLSKPSKDLSSRIMTDVGFEERLIGYRLRARTGPLSYHSTASGKLLIS